jgi:hypothetical protein
LGNRNSIFITQRATAGNATLASQLAAAAAGEGVAAAVAPGPSSSEQEQEQHGAGSRQGSEGGGSSSRSRAAKSGRLAIIGATGGSEEAAASAAVALSRRCVQHICYLCVFPAHVERCQRTMNSNSQVPSPDLSDTLAAK